MRFADTRPAKLLVRTLLVITLLAAAACTSLGRHYLSGDGLGAQWSVTIAGELPHARSIIQQGVQQRIDEVSGELSRWHAGSSLNALNASASAGWQSVPPTLFEALDRALVLAEQTGGAYDPTVGPLVEAWGFGLRGPKYEPPTAQELQAARAHVGWFRIEIDRVARRVQRPEGVVIDLSSMTHGLAADRVASYLRSLGITRYLVDVGGELRVSAPEHAPPWHIAIEHPEGTQPLRVIAVRDAGIATSGDFRYFFDHHGRRYSHRIDPRTGEPVMDDLASVTVVAPESAQADALATALSVLGPTEGFEFAKRGGIAALFVVRTAQGLEERMTPSFSARFN